MSYQGEQERDAREGGEEGMMEQATSTELSELGRRLQAARRIVESSCEVCGKSIRGTTRARYCSPAHRQLAYRQRREGQEKPGD